MPQRRDAEPVQNGSGPDQEMPRQSEDRIAQQGAIGLMLKLEAGLREAKSFNELVCFIANEPCVVTRAQQVFVVRYAGRQRFCVEAVTSMPFVDRSSPLITAVEQLLAGMAADGSANRTHVLDRHAPDKDDVSLLRSYPLPFLLWVPFIGHDDEFVGGMLLARAVPWPERDQTIAVHLGGACAYAWRVMAPNRRAVPAWLRDRRTRLLLPLSLLLAALAMIPVRMSALAPAEVIPRNEFIVTAGVDGVVDEVVVEPNARVKVGDLLIRITDTALKNRHAIAERELAVSEAALKKAGQLAFIDPRGRHDLALAEAEVALKRAERDYAAEMLERSRVRAERDGVAAFFDRKELVGRPVAVGEKLMEIVDPAVLQVQILLSAADSIVLEPAARVRIYFDSDPLRPIEARLVRADYKARVREEHKVAFRLIAAPNAEHEAQLRLGVRGTAQIYSGRAPLALYLLRRPFTAVRQSLGI